MSVITRFAPSPTGFLHIGGARTALFNYLYTKKLGGKFLLRIEDTDKKRSTQEAIEAIIKGLNWLQINYDDEPIFQSKREARHKEIAYELLSKGAAYKCFCTPEELDKLRKKAESEGKAFKYPKIWRDISGENHPDKPFAIRIKAPLEGDIIINDLVQGEVRYPASELDDMVILRADGTPTYMLAVVVDDFDMKITDVIRGDDHLTNTFRQIMIFNAMNWPLPKFAHIPLIHGADGAKLSKRHGALGVEEYQKMGYLPEAICNYIMGLGWSWGEEEIISQTEAISRFDIGKIGRSPSRFDFAKLENINSLYLKKLSDDEVFSQAKIFIENKFGALSGEISERIKKLIPALKERASNFQKLAEQCDFIFARVAYTEKAFQSLEKGREHITPLKNLFSEIDDFSIPKITEIFEKYASQNNIKAGVFLPSLRAAICGTMESPDLKQVIFALGKNEIIKRLENL
ncbi:MAG: glutamate--tRNA ligase [Rickettsiales bacterium]|nr:glutamate--tRNA ligase [Rickettsiales bacterium]